MRNLIIAAAASLGGYFLLTRRRSGGSPPTPSQPLNTRQYHDRLANLLEVAASHGNRPMWEEVSEECRRAGREDLPEHVREQWPEWSERLDRV